MDMKTDCIDIIFITNNNHDIETLKNIFTASKINFQLIIHNKVQSQIAPIDKFSPFVLIIDQEFKSQIPTIVEQHKFNAPSCYYYLSESLEPSQVHELMAIGINDFIFRDQLHHLPVLVMRSIQRKYVFSTKTNFIENSEPQLLFNLLDSASIGIAIYDESMNLLRTNNTSHNIYSPHLDEIIGKNITEILPDVVESGRYEKYLNVLKTGESFFTEHYFTNIQQQHYLLSIRVVSIDSGLGIITFDRSEVKKIKNGIEFKEEQYSSLVVGSTQPICILDKSGIVLYTNSIAAQKLEKKRTEIIGQHIKTVLPYKQVDTLLEQISIIIDKNHSSIHELPILINDQLKFWLETRIYPIKTSEEAPNSALIFINDITKRKEAEDEHNLLAEAINHSIELVLIANNKYKIKYVNSTFMKKTSLDKVDVIGKPVFDYINAQHNKTNLPSIWKKVREGREWSGNLYYNKKHNDIFEGETTIAPIMSPEGELLYFVMIIRDVTEEREMEKKLRQTQKMETIGTLAGGIAHDFNNILVPILGYSELLSDRIPDKENYKQYTDHIIKAGYRAKDLINQILTFSRKVEQEKRPVYIQTILKEVIKLLRASIPSSIEIIQEIDNHCNTVLADPTQIHQVIMNLSVNAFHAMRDKGGTLKIVLTNIEFKEKQPNLKLNPGHYVKLEVNDTGEGMDSTTIDRIFEPFFTTKNEQGTGLGLSVVHGIIISHDGEINVSSNLGKGTTFNIFLPVHVEYEDIVEQNSAIPTGTERILFVDDENEIVELNQQILAQLGYTPTVTTDSLEALELFRKSPQDFDLIFTDFTMPRMNGLTLTQQIRELRQDIPIILCTGYSENVTEDNVREFGVTEFVFKPLTMSSIAQIIRKALDSTYSRAK